MELSEAKQGFAGYRRARFPNYTTAARPTCDSTAIGIPIWNTTLTLPQMCDGTNYLNILTGVGGATVGIPTTLLTNAVDIVNSVWGSLDNLNFEGTTADTVEGQIGYTDDGAGIGTFAIEPDEDTNSGFQVRTRPLAGASGFINNIVAVLLAMDGSDTVNLLNVPVTNANHTGTGNTLNLINVAAVTGDANSNLNAINIGALTGTAPAASEQENAITVGAGWDMAFNTTSISATGAVPTIGFYNGTTFAGMGLTSFTSGTGTLRLDVPGLPSLIVLQHILAGVGGNIFLMNTSLTAMNGSDTVSYVAIAPVNANHTGTGNTVNMIEIAAITGDANSNLNGLSIGALTGTTGAASEVEAAIKVGTGWDTGLQLGVGMVTTEPADIAVVGAAQTIAPTTNYVQVSAGAAADVTIVTPLVSTMMQEVTFFCSDANLTFTDGGAAGAANTIDLAGNFVCSGGDTISMVFNPTPESGNARWKEKGRSVN